MYNKTMMPKKIIAMKRLTKYTLVRPIDIKQSSLMEYSLSTLTEHNNKCVQNMSITIVARFK